MAYAKNAAEFYSLYNEPVSKAVEYVMQQILVNYKHLINQIIYAHIPEEYERTYEFLESWQTKSQKTRQGGSGILSQDPTFMSYNPEMFQHGSLYTTYGDVRDELTGIIYQGLGGDLFGYGWWCKPRDAWTPLIEQLNKGELKKWFIEGMQKQGIQCRSVGRGKNISSFW